MSDIDAALLALLRGALANVHDGQVTDSDNDAKTISAPLPYALYFGLSSFPVNARLGGSRDKGYDVAVNCVGMTREQADWAADKVEAALSNARISRSRLVTLDERVRPRRDDTWSRPDGGSLFSASLRFTV